MPESTLLVSRYQTVSRSMSDPEAETIGALISRGFGPGTRLDPGAVFPRGSEDHVDSATVWAYRFMLECLAGKGLLRRVRLPDQPLGLWPIEMTQAAIDAYQHWYDRRGHMGSEPNALLP